MRCRNIIAIVGLSGVVLSFAGAAPAWAGDESVGLTNFVGSWTLKDDAFEQVWDGITVQHVTIPSHIAVCTTETTASSVSCAVDGGGLTGQIFWVIAPDGETLHHLSHFGKTRLGHGTGRIDPDGNLRNRIRFLDEPEGTYRIYTYDWAGPDEYVMMSRQYGPDDAPTGNYYAGTFVRIPD